MQAEGALPSLATIEMPLVPVLVAMECRGICFSREVLLQQRPAMDRRLRQLEAEAAAAIGGTRFNLAAPAEVSKVLFEQLKLPPPPGTQLLK
jgi:DNA polymerase I-like protein with 3'-5' exonuclease and polymerase domains